MELTVQTMWKHLVAWYLFLAGAGAGMYLIAMGIKFYSPKNALNKVTYYYSPLVIIIATFVLLIDLGQPLRAPLAIIRLHSSMISIGTLILSCFMMIGLFQGYCYYTKRQLKAIWDYVGCFFAVGTAVYTGLLLGVVKAIPFWNNPVLPVLFLVSAVSAGVALLLIINAKTFVEDKKLLADILKFDAGLLVVEVILLVFLIIISLNGNAASVKSAQILLGDFMAIPFWVGVVGLGLVVPLYMDITKKISSYNSILVFALSVLAGGLALRYAIVLCGVYYPMGY